MCNNCSLQVPNSDIVICPNYKVKLGRFDTEKWVVKHGWYSWGGNRPVCGWYLISDSDNSKLKPLQLTDLDDIYIVEIGNN